MQRLDSDASPARKDPSFPEGAGRRTGGTMRTGPASWPREPTSAGAAAAGPALAIAGINSAALFPNTDFLDQIFLLRALILRHLRLLYRDTRFGFLIEYVRPSIVIAFHYVLFTWLKRPMPAKIPTELFIIGSFTIWFSATHVMHAAPSADRQAAGFPGVTSVHLLLARTLWEYLSMLSFAMFCVILLKIIGLREPIPDLSLSALYFLLAATIGLGLALILLALGRVSAVTSTLDKNLYWILFVTTGHYFSIATVQPVIANIVWYNPLLHLVELQRHALYPGYPTALVSYWYPAVVAAGLVIFGLILEKCTRHRVHR
jgi:capsular polysaccharide transport system permease protein